MFWVIRYISLVVLFVGWLFYPLAQVGQSLGCQLLHPLGHLAWILPLNLLGLDGGQYAQGEYAAFEPSLGQQVGRAVEYTGHNVYTTLLSQSEGTLLEQVHLTVLAACTLGEDYYTGATFQVLRTLLHYGSSGLGCTSLDNNIVPQPEHPPNGRNFAHLYLRHKVEPVVWGYEEHKRNVEERLVVGGDDVWATIGGEVLAPLNAHFPGGREAVNHSGHYIGYFERQSALSTSYEQVDQCCDGHCY